MFAAACVSAVGAPEKPLSIRLVPASTELQGAGAAQQFLVIAACRDGLERDVTRESRLLLSNERLARVEPGGRVSAAADGQLRIKAEMGGLAAEAAVVISGSQETRPFSFARDIGGILTKRGCNDRDCHGSVKGKGGFKLSPNALYPMDDYRWIVEGGVFQVLSAEPGGPKTPRIRLDDPEKSLLLLKPTAQVAHGGGRRFSVGSADFHAVLSWIRSGAPYGAEDSTGSARVEKIEAYPKEAVLDTSGKQQLLVSALLSNGHREDITDQVLYVSNNPEVVAVNGEGLVRAVKTGETAVMIRAAGHAVSARFAVIGSPVSHYPSVAANNFIDANVFRRLRRFNIVPSDLSSDSEFLRRVCLDLTGTLPPPGRVREFVKSEDPRKRENLVDALLRTPEYVDYWTFRFADLFRVAYYAQGNPKYSEIYGEWIRDSIAGNKPYDQMARERIAAEGAWGPSHHFYHTGGELPHPQDMMAEEVRVFFGRRLDCAQCHNHPYENWSQDQFWGMAAFFGRLTRLGQLGGDLVIIDDPAGHGEFGQGAQVIHPRSKEVVEPRFLDGTALPAGKRADPRWELAHWMTSHPYFAEAAVNRIWGYFFARGIVHPPDDFRETNPATDPELLEALARDFKDHGYDLKYLIRTIVESRTYQLSGAPNETNKEDLIHYSRAVARPLDAEVLLDAISQVEGLPQDFRTWMGGREPRGTRAINLFAPDVYPSHFLDVYGRPNRLMVPERRVDPNLGQALDLLAGGAYNEKLSAPGGRLDGLMRAGATNRQIVEEFYLAALSRYPTEGEGTALEKAIDWAKSRREALEDFVWGLITAREFAYNH
jgi:hypothetical protein